MVEALEQPLLLPKDMATLRHVKQPDLFISLKRDLALVGFLACLIEGIFSFSFLYSFFLTYSLVVYMQVIQEVFVAEEWVKNARNKVRVEAKVRT